MWGQKHRQDGRDDVQIVSGALSNTAVPSEARFGSTCRICLLSAFTGLVGLILLYLLIATGIVYAIP